MKVLTNPDTEDMEMCFPEQSSFYLGGNLYLIAEQDGILLTDKTKHSKKHGKLLDLSWVIFLSGHGYAPSG
jgi:hypothetical protein